MTTLMDRKNPFSARSFFKVLLPGFHQNLNLPPALSEELKKCKSRKATLESRIGIWKIGLCKNSKNDLISFKHGWPEFVRRHSLSVGDFLVFQPTRHLHFNVSVFDSTAFEKEFPDETKKSIEATDLTAEDEAEAPYFMTTMQPQHARKRAVVNMPRNFVKSNNLGKQRHARLRDERGREWRVSVMIGTKDGSREKLGKGWDDFYASNSNAITHGTICVFKLIPPKTTHNTIFFHVHFLPPLKLGGILYKQILGD